MTGRSTLAAGALRLAAVVCLLAPVAAALAAPTSELRFRKLVAPGADDKTIAALLQDRQSFIWVGALNGGLYRYDGYRAVKYAYDPANPRSLPSDRVSIVYEDQKGRIWIGTYDGLARFDPATNDFTRFKLGTLVGVPHLVRNIISDGKDGLWLGTWAGIQHFNPDTGAYIQYLHKDGDPGSPQSNGADSMALDARGGLWFETWPRGLDYLPPGGKAFQHFRVDSDAAPDAQANAVHALRMDRAQRLWIGTGNGVYRWTDGSDWSTRARMASPDSRVSNFFEDGEGTMWAGTWTAGLLRWRAGSDRLVQFTTRGGDPHSLHIPGVAAVMRDRTNMLWVGTFNAGISVSNLGSQGFARFVLPLENVPDPQPNVTTQAIAPAGDGRLWVGGLNGLSLNDVAGGTMLRTLRMRPGQADTLASDRINHLYQQPGGPLWIGTSAGLSRLDRPDGPVQTVHFGEGAADLVAVIAPGRDGMLWLGTDDSTIHYDPRSGRRRVYRIEKDQPQGRRIAGASTIVEDRQGRVWMASQWRRGLEMLDPASGRFRFFEHGGGGPGALSDDAVSSLHEDGQGRLWAGTAKGLDQIVTGADGAIRFVPQSARSGSERVFAIQSEAGGRLWLSTEDALIRYDPASGKSDRYTAVDGLIDNFKVGAAFTAPDGTLYFAGAPGVSIVRPALVGVVSVAPTVAITDISVFNRSLGTGLPPGVRLDGPLHAPRGVELPPGQSVLSIEFAALHFTSPGLNRYAYMLEGFDRDWVQADAAHRIATYTNLAPGSYSFRVKASNDRGLWGGQAADLAVTVRPAFWQTWWFRGLCAAALLLALAGAYWARIGALKRIQRRLAALVAERTGELEQSNRQLAESNAKLALLSSTDGLTGVSNRRAFDVALEEAWARATRGGEPLALALIDVDHFKLYNDTYGHQDGDRCLRAVAAALAAQCRRPDDLAARYGGEEFALLLPLNDEAGALQLAADACAAVAALRMPHAASSEGIVTVSIGVAFLAPTPGQSAELLLRRADQALYDAKRSGRNRVHLAAGSLAAEAGSV
jgi:diguanylate cyclase (GGDEF)-like protein